MAYREFDGKTEAEAVEKACIELGIPRKSLRYDVLSHGSTGIFGLAKVRKAKIRVKTDDEPAPRPAAKAEPSSAASSSAEASEEAKPVAPEQKGRRGQKPKPPKAASGKGRADKASMEPWPEKTSSPSKKEEPSQEPEKAEKARPSRSSRKRKRDSAAKKAAEAGVSTSEAISASPASRQQKKQRAPAPDSPDAAKSGAAPKASSDDQDFPGESQTPLDPLVLEQVLGHAGEIMTRLSQALMDEPSVSTSHVSGHEILVRVDGPDAANLIGRKGQTLDAVQHVLEAMLNKDRRPKIRIRVDAGDYLARREENLVKLALRLGEKVKKSGRAASFSPMPANERRIIHLALKDDPLLRTQSKGSGELRKLIIGPRKTEEPKADA